MTNTLKFLKLRGTEKNAHLQNCEPVALRAKRHGANSPVDVRTKMLETTEGCEKTAQTTNDKTSFKASRRRKIY